MPAGVKHGWVYACHVQHHLAPNAFFDVRVPFSVYVWTLVAGTIAITGLVSCLYALRLAYLSRFGGGSSASDVDASKYEEDDTRSDDEWSDSSDTHSRSASSADHSWRRVGQDHGADGPMDGERAGGSAAMAGSSADQACSAEGGPSRQKQHRTKRAAPIRGWALARSALSLSTGASPRGLRSSKHASAAHGARTGSHSAQHGAPPSQLSPLSPLSSSAHFRSLHLPPSSSSSRASSPLQAPVHSSMQSSPLANPQLSAMNGSQLLQASSRSASPLSSSPVLEAESREERSHTITLPSPEPTPSASGAGGLLTRSSSASYLCRRPPPPPSSEPSPTQNGREHELV